MNAPIANAVASSLNIAVVRGDQEVINAFLKDHRENVEKKMTSLDDCFQIGCSVANFTIYQDDFASHKVGNGTGYYDPLMDAIFTDAEGNEVPASSSIATIDSATNRRVLIFVIRSGENIVIHDRYSQNSGSPVVLVMTGGAYWGNILGMSPAWAEGVNYDLAMCAKLLGFEYSRHEDKVYVPYSKPTNLIQEMYKAGAIVQA